MLAGLQPDPDVLADLQPDPDVLADLPPDPDVPAVGCGDGARALANL